MSSGKRWGGAPGTQQAQQQGAAQMAVDSVWVFLGRTLTLTLIINKGHLPWSAWLITTLFRPPFSCATSFWSGPVEPLFRYIGTELYRGAEYDGKRRQRRG